MLGFAMFLFSFICFLFLNHISVKLEKKVPESKVYPFFVALIIGVSAEIGLRMVIKGW